MTQPRHDPALDNLHTHFGFRLVLGLIGSGRDDRALVVRYQLLIAGRDRRLIAVGFSDRALEIIRHNDLR